MSASASVSVTQGGHNKWAATGRTQTRKMREIVPGIPPKVPKRVLFSVKRGLSATYPERISTIFETRRRELVSAWEHQWKISECLRRGVFHVQKCWKWVLSRGCLYAVYSSNGTIRRESLRGLVDIPRMCLLYVDFGGERTVWVRKTQILAIAAADYTEHGILK